VFACKQSLARKLIPVAKGASKYRCLSTLKHPERSSVSNIVIGKSPCVLPMVGNVVGLHAINISHKVDIKIRRFAKKQAVLESVTIDTDLVPSCVFGPIH